MNPLDQGFRHVTARAHSDVRFRSLAAPQNSTISRAAIGCIPAVPQRFFKNQKLKVCFSRKRTFKLLGNHESDRPLTARSGHRKNRDTMAESNCLVGGAEIEEIRIFDRRHSMNVENPDRRHSMHVKFTSIIEITLVGQAYWSVA